MAHEFSGLAQLDPGGLHQSEASSPVAVTFCRGKDIENQLESLPCDPICCYTYLRRTLTTRFVAQAVGLGWCRNEQY